VPRISCAPWGGRARDDLHLRRTPLDALLEEAAEPHVDRGKRIHFEHAAGMQEPRAHPTVLRRPEVIHGLRNLIQNAVDFARENVWVEKSLDRHHHHLADHG